MAYQKRYIPLKGYTISIKDAKRIYQLLSAYVTAEGASDVEAFTKPPNMTDQDFAAEKQRWLSNAYKITVTINGIDESSLYEDHEGIFDSPNLPSRIANIFMTNVTAFEGTTRMKPANSFQLNIDFSKPPLLDGNNLVSSPTPNFSHVTIEGTKDSWLATIADKVTGVVGPKKNRRRFLHAPFVYDFGLMVFGVPAGLYLCWKSSGFVYESFSSMHGVVTAAAYIYLFFLALWGYRIMFGYAKWAFPIVELEEEKSASAQHRIFWLAIVLGVLGNFAYDVLKRI